MKKLIDLCTRPYDSATSWAEDSNQAFAALFGSDGGRYPARAENEIQLRTPKIDKGVPFSAIIHESNPSSGGYGGISVVIIAVEDSSPMTVLAGGTHELNTAAHHITQTSDTRNV